MKKISCEEFQNMSKNDKIRLQALKNVMERKAKAEAEAKSKETS